MSNLKCLNYYTWKEPSAIIGKLNVLNYTFKAHSNQLFIIAPLVMLIAYLRYGKHNPAHMPGYNSRLVHDHSGHHMQWCYSHTFISSHWLPAAESTTSTLCTNGYPYKVLLPYLQSCDGEWWGGRCAGVCGRRGSGPPILNGVLWVGQSTQVSWRRPGDLDCSSCGQWLQWDHPWGTHCSKKRGTLYMRHNYHKLRT